MLALLLALTSSAAVVDEVAEVSSFRAMRKAEGAPSIPTSAYTKAEAGQKVTGIEFVDGVSAGKGWGVSVMNAPVESVWMAINNEEAYPGTFKNLAQTKVVYGTPRMTDRYLFQLMNVPVISDRWWVIHQHHNGDLYTASSGRLWEKYWTDATDPANLAGAEVGRAIPVGWVQGAWLLVPLADGRTLVEYYSWSDPGGMIPAGPASRFAAGAIRDMLGRIEGMAQGFGTDRSGYVRPDQSAL